MASPASRPPPCEGGAEALANLSADIPVTGEDHHDAVRPPTSTHVQETSVSPDPTNNLPPPTPSGPPNPEVDLKDGGAVLPRRKEWRSWKLDWPFNAVFLISNIGFIVAIIVLEQLSLRKGGIATISHVDDQSNFVGEGKIFAAGKLRRYYGLLWTSLPALIFTLFSITWATIIAASSERQPFVELRRGATLRRTIMLDYRVYPAFYNWVVAFLRHHQHLSCAMFLSLIVVVVIVPLSAHLFVLGASIRESSVNVSFATQFNDSLFLASTNLQPFLNVATAILVYGSIPPAWMTNEYAFVPFSTPPTSSSGPSNNLSVTTDAYSASLDCHALNDGSYNVTYNDQGTSSGSDHGTVTVDFFDRSCHGMLLLEMESVTPTYARTFYVTCPDQSANRIAMLAGAYSSSSPVKLSDFSVISCIPSYWHSTGSLTVSLGGGTSAMATNYVDFIVDSNATRVLPAFNISFESALHEYTIFDPAAATNADSLGFSILSSAVTAAGKDVTAAMTPKAIKNATERVFTTIYAAMTASVLLSPAETVTNTTGVLVKPVNRLLVARPIAYTIVVVLVLVLANHLVLWECAIRHTSVLSEEPIGLLGNAVLLDQSNVGQVVSRVRAIAGEEGTVRNCLKKAYDVDRALCHWSEPEGRVVMEGPTEKSQK